MGSEGLARGTRARSTPAAPPRARRPARLRPGSEGPERTPPPTLTPTLILTTNDDDTPFRPAARRRRRSARGCKGRGAVTSGQEAGEHDALTPISSSSPPPAAPCRSGPPPLRQASTPAGATFSAVPAEGVRSLGTTTWPTASLSSRPWALPTSAACPAGPRRTAESSTATSGGSGPRGGTRRGEHIRWGNPDVYVPAMAGLSRGLPVFLDVRVVRGDFSQRAEANTPVENPLCGRRRNTRPDTTRPNAAPAAPSTTLASSPSLWMLAAVSARRPTP